MTQEDSGLLPLDPETRRQIAMRLQRIVTAAEQEISGISERWDINERFYENDPSVVQGVLDDMEMFAFPLIQPRIDALNDHVIGTITTASPYLLVKKKGTAERLTNTEATLHFFAHTGGLKEALKKIGIITGNTNMGILRCWFDVGASVFRPTDYAQGQMSADEIQYAGFRYDVIHPGDFVCYPHSADIQIATAVGHRFRIRSEDVKELQDAGRYYEDVKPIDSPNNTIDYTGRDPAHARVTNQRTGDRQDEMPVLHELIVKMRLPGDDAERYYKFVNDAANCQLYAAEVYNKPRPNYFDFRYLPRNYGSFYSSNAIATNLQGLQRLYTVLNNLMIYASVYAAFPGGVSNGLGNQAVEIKWGQVTPAQGEVTMLPTTFNPQAVFQNIMQIEAVADSVVRITRAGLAMGGNSGKTATQQMAEDAGMQSGIAGFIDTFGATLEQVYDFMAHCLYGYWDIWYPIYQDDLPANISQDMFIGPFMWELYNKTPSTSPTQTIQKMQLILQLAQADQTEVITQVMQMLSQVLPENIMMAVQNQIQAIQGQHMNPKAVVRTILNVLDIPNKDEILNEVGGNNANMVGTGIPPMLAATGGGMPGTAPAPSQEAGDNMPDSGSE